MPVPMPYKRVYQNLPILESNTLGCCTQMQIRYTCGHSTGGEFIKCRRHMHTDDERCPGRQVAHVDFKISPHKCRSCLRSA
ncbi:hypothetical protein PENANT_c004G02425 [Penicillium antarcticum]|uniref:Uncharacterized protein n=1 Tax=Penicillium antarcticum TaxID=416450 RepID=A0A1V6QGS0_9EURO|nr:uncharacterized protein N7508_002208 [Penicillium antarcticum]KAJ5317700.1 hypothetical protein N7508_002208 [Penicillium antarcticum]OQD88408.1 hypothetical protein PENANT_c004G02425 [Penicillium antarcticum]